MTNDQETIVSQDSGSEAQISQQESVQLTELLPVEQSRIKNIPDYKDPGATDGLRALRSFSRGDQDENFVAQREFDCYRKIERSYGDEEELMRQRNSLRKRKNPRGSKPGINKVLRITRSAKIVVADESRENYRTRRKRKNVGEDWSEESCESEENSEDELNLDNLVMDDEEEEEDDVETDEKELIIDEEDRYESILRDEVYDYRQNPEIGDNSTNDEATSLEMLSAGVYRDMATNFSVGSRPRDAESSRKNPSKRITRKILDPQTEESSQADKEKKKPGKGRKKAKKKAKKKPVKNLARGKISEDKNGSLSNENLSNGADAEEDLRLKIDGIIQANCLLEQENNNDPVETMNSKESACSPGEKEVLNDEDRTSNDEESSKDQAPNDQTKKYCCLMCNSRFKGSGGLRNHYKVVHAAGPIYKCDECGKEFPLKERLKLHVRTHTGFKPYKCPDCHKSFARGGQLVQHRGTHSKIKPYRCSLCSGTFTCAANLALHVKRHKGQKDHKCEICGRGFVRKDALKKHLECLHRDVKSFLCSICNKTFKGHLPQHMRTHAQDRPHGCATCGQRFAQKSQLTVHQRTHSGQRPFRCLVCWQAFAHSTALKLHTRRHTGERPFKCAECNAGFTQLPHWKKHMKCIHGRSEPYNCKNCNSFFRIKNDLENHEKACFGTEAAGNLSPVSNEASSRDPTGIGQKCSQDPPRFRVMNVERMRLLLAVLLKRISRPERLDELGFGKRLIDQVLQDSLISAGKVPSKIGELNELECLRKNLETFLEWTVPKEHWDKFQKINKTPEEILETLTAT